MKLVTKFALSCSAIITLSLPAFAGVTVNSPSNDADVSSPFTLSASAAVCSSKGVVSMGYSFDSSSDTTVVHDQSIDKQVPVAAGTHILHVKAWAPHGRSCVKDVKIHVAGGTTSSDASSARGMIPSHADTVSSIEALGGWQGTHDRGGPGSTSGSTKMVTSPSMFGSSRRFETSFRNAGDHRYSVVFSDDTNAKNFFYDAWVYLTNSADKLANIEMDVNQVMSNGNTVLIGLQCDGYTGNWAYNVNKGNASHPRPHWQSKGGTACNPRSWARNKWHHIQASFYRSDNGTVTYRSVWLDGKETKLNVQAFCGADLHWDPVINTQFQLDGMGKSGTVTAYLDHLTISMW